VYCHGLPENQDILDDNTNAPEPGTDIIYKNKEGLQDFLKAHPYPMYSFDFETINYGIPEFDNSRPYQQIPFQYSLHYQKDANSKPKHFEFLGNGKDDPREALIQQLIKDVGKQGDILVYFKPFEKTRLIELARDFPQYKTELNAIKNRLVDLAVPYRKYLKTEATQKKWSLKIVLPAYLPDRSYDGLDIQQGLATMDVYRNFSHLSEAEALEARQAMLDYCKLDTLGVLELYKHLFNLADY
jgi:hypothetical protein